MAWTLLVRHSSCALLSEGVVRDVLAHAVESLRITCSRVLPASPLHTQALRCQRCKHAC